MKSGLPAPGPAEAFTLTLERPEDASVWFHVYNTLGRPATRADTFSEGWGNTRFGPINQADGTPVHTFYMGSTAECAYMESVLHDAVLEPLGLFEVDRLRYFRLVQVRLRSALQCVNFHTPYLPRLQRMTRAQLIDSLPDCYPETRAWAQAAFLQRADAQAIAYGSRRNDAVRCLMLFKQRIAGPPFEILKEEPLAVDPRRAEVLALVRRLKLNEI